LSNLFAAGQPAVLALQLSDGAVDQFPRAFIYRAGALETTVALTHVAQGLYQGPWTPAAAEPYEVIYLVYMDAPRTIESLLYERTAEEWQPSVVVSLDVADKVLDEMLAGHTAVGSVGEALARLALLEKLQRNRLELAEGSANNWVLYDDDSVTPLLRWSVTDKAGAEIRMNSFVPARRNRGA